MSQRANLYSTFRHGLARGGDRLAFESWARRNDVSLDLSGDASDYDSPETRLAAEAFIAGTRRASPAPASTEGG